MIFGPQTTVSNGTVSQYIFVFFTGRPVFTPATKQMHIVELQVLCIYIHPCVGRWLLTEWMILHQFLGTTLSCFYIFQQMKLILLNIFRKVLAVYKWRKHKTRQLGTVQFGFMLQVVPYYIVTLLWDKFSWIS